jgi:hypothetical protein
MAKILPVIKNTFIVLLLNVDTDAFGNSEVSKTIDGG